VHDSAGAPHVEQELAKGPFVHGHREGLERDSLQQHEVGRVVSFGGAPGIQRAFDAVAAGQQAAGFQSEPPARRHHGSSGVSIALQSSGDQLKAGAAAVQMWFQAAQHAIAQTPLDQRQDLLVVQACAPTVVDLAGRRRALAQGIGQGQHEVLR
jgi:hypothetical protein